MYSSQPPRGIALDDLLSGSQALRNKQVRAARATTKVADLRKPLDRAGIVAIPTMTTGAPIRFAQLPDFLLVGFDPARLTTELAIEITREAFGDFEFVTAAMPEAGDL